MSLAADFDTLIRQLGTSQAWWQLGLIAAGFVLAWAIARLIRPKLPSNLPPGARKIGAGSILRLVVPVLALVFVWCGKLLLARWHPVPILQLAVLLIASFAAIRLAIYLLRHWMAPSAALKASERGIAYGIWFLVALYLTGVLPEIANALDDVKFVVGTQKLSLLLVFQAMASAAFAVFVTLSLSRVIEQRLLETTTLDMSMRVVSSKFVRAFAVVAAVLIALQLIGIDLTVLSVFGGALGVGLGLGMQKIASNYVSGFVILLDRSIRPGDVVTISDRHGVVADIKARYTVLRGMDGTEAIIPNDTIISNTVLNHSYSDKKIAMKTAVTVSYQSDVALAMQLLLESGKAQNRVLTDPPPNVNAVKLGEKGIELELSTWIHDADQGQGPLRSAILLAAWQRFQANGITIPTD